MHSRIPQPPHHCHVPGRYEWPARIAEVALWLMDHQSNLHILAAFGQPYQRLPLKQSPHIHIANALRMDWNDLLPAKDCSYVLGNPPFVGHQWRSAEQVEDMALIWGNAGKFARLDYVACWFRVATQHMMNNVEIRSGFVATNSISQGEQVGTSKAFPLRCSQNFLKRDTASLKSN